MDKNYNGLGNEAKLSFLKNFPLFRGLNADEQQQMAGMMEHRVYARYEMLYQAGGSSDVLFLLAGGTVKTGTHSSDGKEVIKRLIHPLAMFGDMGLVGESRRREFAQALKEDVHVYLVKVSDLQLMMSKNFALCSLVMSNFGQRLMSAEEKLESLIFKDARTRIIDFIRQSVETHGRRVGYEMLFRHSLTHQDIANITCTSRQTVTLVLNELKKSDQIYFNRGKILVRDVESLS